MFLLKNFEKSPITIFENYSNTMKKRFKTKHNCKKLKMKLGYIYCLHISDNILITTLFR